MTREQLQAARAAHWRQNQNPLLTLEDAESWVEQHPLCLFLPRRTQLPVPAPSFVEACVGSAQTAPGAAAIEQAQGLLTRLIASGSVVALNLFGAVGEQADFLAHRQALPYVIALRADADWKHAPQKSSGHKVSPLVLELWKALEEKNGLTAAEAQEKLGRELTEAAVLRGLCELWQGLRVSPVFGGAGEPARWELLRERHRDALTTATGTGQVTALSLLVSMYLQSVYAATGDEVEIFLSPVASRSRVREAVRGLSATRQIFSLSMDAQTYYFLENGLPEFAEVAVAAQVPSPPPVRRPVSSPAVRNAQGPRPARPAAAARPTSVPRPTSAPRPISAPRPASARPASARPNSAPRPAARTSSPRLPSEQPWKRKTEWKPRPAAAGEGAEPARRGTRPAQKPGKRPNTWPGDAKQAKPRPWARPSQGPAAPRTPRGPGDRPFRSTNQPRPQAPSGNAPPSAGRERFAGRPSRPFRPDARPGPRPDSRPGSRPDSRPGSRPDSRPGSRPDSRPGSRPDSRPGSRFSGPRTGAPRRSETKSNTDRPNTDRSNTDRPNSARPPFAPRPSSFRPKGPFKGPAKGLGRSGPPKPWSRAGAPSGRPGRKPGKPPSGFRGRKPDGRKPGA